MTIHTSVPAKIHLNLSDYFRYILDSFCLKSDESTYTDLITHTMTIFNESILDLTNWCKETEKAATEFGREMEQLYDEPMEFITSYKETKEICLDKLIKGLYENLEIKTVYVTKGFFDDYHNHQTILSDYMKDLLALFPNATLSYYVQ